MTRKIAAYFGILTLALGLTCLTLDAAEAARLGGGRSFGSRPTYTNPASKPAPSYNQSKPSNPGQQNVAQPAQRPGGRFGGLMGGLFGGLLAGSLLGALFFGMPFAGGGLMDFLLIGLVLFLAFKFFSSRRRASEQQSSGAYQRQAESMPPQDRWSESQWDRLRAAPSGHAGGVQAEQAGPAIHVPGFDEEEFLRGAKLAYTRLQAAWDARDLGDISEFATPEVMAEIKRQAAQDPKPSKTDILMVNARLLEVREQGAHTVASVYFDVLMRENQAQSSPEQVREVWHFRRETADPKSSWKLEGIQQLEI